MSTSPAAETLSRLSRLAGQQFASVTDATQAVLETITDVFGMRTSWVSTVETEESRLAIVSAHNEEGGCNVLPGGSAPLELTFCNLIISADKPQPLIIEDVRNNPAYHDCAAAQTFPTVGSYVGVPIVLGDDTIYGTLCACDPDPVKVTSQQVQLLSVLSRLLATQIERDHELLARVRTEKRFNAFMDNSPAIAFMKDTEGRYLYANRGWYEAFDRENGWIIGKLDTDFLDYDTAMAVRERDAIVLQSNVVAPIHETSTDADGQQRHWYSIKFPVDDGDGGFLLGGVSADITESHKRQMESALLAAIVSDTQDAIYAKTLEGVITAWNPAAERLYGYTANEMVGRTLDILIPPDMPSDLDAIHQRLQEGDRVAQYETWRRAKNGDLLLVEISLSYMKDIDGAVFGISTIARDITEHMRLIAERDQLLDELQGEFHKAAEIQSHLLPTTVPLLPGFEFAALCRPARDVGGDFFDWADTGENLRITLGDVTGKGMAAALLMATTRAALRGAAKEPVDEALTTVNRALMGDLSQSDAFVTIFHADLCLDGRLTYTDGGHGLAVIIRNDGSVEHLKQQQLPIGIVETPYKSTDTQLEEGDLLIVFSDGLPDSCPDLNLEDPVNIAPLVDAGADLNQMLEAIECQSRDNGPRPDDLTLLAVRRRKTSV